MDKHQARLREALAGPPTEKSKGPPVADGTLTVTPDTQEAMEWRTRRSIIDGPTSSSYLEDDSGPQPHELYAKYTWRIEHFKDIQKRELRSTVFRVGDFKWYVLVYPQGCDVCNHLSLFLCVADYDKLLPGWAHFAQFTIAVVNKDPKKSKYSDTLHRFCKKEHDWGWKKFMEISKVFEGFTVSDTLVIKAQVQVIRDRPNAPFRCLDPQYRRELVRVYLTNVETICRKFVEEKREWLCRLRDNAGFRAYWDNLPRQKKKALQADRGQDVLKGLVKRFFNEKEVTSTLVMDALFSGCKQLEEASNLLLEAKKPEKAKAAGDNALGGITVNAEKNTFGIAGNAQLLLEKAASETVPPFREDKVSENLGVRNAQDGDDYSKDFVERDERRLADLGRRAVEMYIISQIFAELETAHNEAESMKRQEELIAAEELAASLARDLHEKKADKDREKKARKKERQRVKKEAEEKEKEAKEAERRAQEDARRLEQERKAQEAAERRRREEEQREKDREVALKEAAATFRAREATRIQQAVSRVESAPILRPESRPLVAHPVGTGSVSDDGSDLSARGGELETIGRQGQPGEDNKPGTSAPAQDGDGSTTLAASVDSEDAFSDAFNSSSSTQSDDELVTSLRDQLEATKKDLATAEAAAAQVPGLRTAVVSLQERVKALEGELAARCEEIAQARGALVDARIALTEREAEVSALRAVAAAVTVAAGAGAPAPAGRATPAPAASHGLASAPSLTGSASTTTVADLGSTMSDASVDSQPPSPPASPHGLPHGAHRAGAGQADGGDASHARHPSTAGPPSDGGLSYPGENGAGQQAGPTQHAPLQHCRTPRAVWNGVVQASNGLPGPSHAPALGAGGRGRQGKGGPGPHAAPAGSDAGNPRGGAPPTRVSMATQITDRDLKEANAAVERALRPARTSSVPEPLAPPSPSQRSGAGPGGKGYTAGPRGSKGTNAGGLANKALNGSAAPFVPSTINTAMSAPGNLPPPPPNAPMANGVGPHPAPSAPAPVASYRNAAVGAMPVVSMPPPADPPRHAPINVSGPPPPGPLPPPPAGPPLRPAGNNGMAQHGVRAGPDPPRDAGRAPPVNAMALLGLGQPGDNGFRPHIYRQELAAFQTPPPAKQRAGDGLTGHDTPGGVTNLDDFAHMGLITDLLD